MAESVSRRAILKSAWAEYWNDDEARPPINHYFECGFDAAWDALMDEIRSLVADLKLASEYNANDSIGQQVSDRLKHADAVERLRKLVREAGE